MYRSNYKRYRKYKRTNLLKKVLVVLLLFVVGFSTAFFFLGDSDPKGFVEGLFSDEEQIKTEPLDTDVAVSGDSITDVPEIVIEEPSIKNDIKGLEVDLLLVNDPNYFEQIKTAITNGTINTLVIPMKNLDGTFNYQSGVLYKNAGTINVDVTEFLKKALELDVYLIADVATYSDNLYVNHYLSDGIVTANSGYVFLDGFGMRWISPYSETGNTYIKEVLLEISNYGFDEIMLSGHSFPQFGKTNLINYNGSVSNEQILADRVSEFKSLLNMPVSVKMTPYYFDAENPAKQDAGLLTKASDRLFFTVLNEEQSINVSPFPNVGHFSNNTNLNNNIVKTLA